MHILFLIISITFLISLIAFVGALFLLLRRKLFDKILLTLVAFSAGALIGSAFLHLIPESLERFDSTISLYVLIGFIFFFFVESILHWRHCHNLKCTIHKVRTFAYMNLIGEAIHNFIDGLIIATSFVVDIKLGIITSFAIALHEIPQEISDIGVLVYGGFNKIKALILNFSVALTVVLGGIFGYYLVELVSEFIIFLLPFAAGGFIYIAASDLIPEIRKEVGIKKSLITFGIFLIGILVMFGIKFL
jgi:zinc and cadmium transporter